LSETAKTDAAARRYLLGELSEDEKTRMEEAFFADDANFEALELAEDELIDAYVRNELSPEEQQEFYSTLLRSPRLRERVNFARILAAKADADQSATRLTESTVSASTRPGARWWTGFFAQQPAWRMAMSASAILILVAGVVLVSGWLRLRNESQRLASERAALQRQKEQLDKLSGEQRTNEQLIAELQRERQQRADDIKFIEQHGQGQTVGERSTKHSVLTTIATVFLTPGSLRSNGGGQSELIIGPKTTTASVRLALENNDYATYSATIKTANGVTVDRQNRIQARTTGTGPILSVSIPARRLPPGDYLIHVDGVLRSGQIESFNDYQFRVSNSK
jgi:hypothetical protein